MTAILFRHQCIKHTKRHPLFCGCRLKEDRMRFLCNLEVQLLMKQGQVEIDSGPFIPEYNDSILIHRSTVEELNGKIRVCGGG